MKIRISNLPIFSRLRTESDLPRPDIEGNSNSGLSLIRRVRDEEDNEPEKKPLEWGLIHAVVPHAVIADTSFDLARRLAEMPTRGLGLTKRGFNAAFSNTLDEQLALEEELQREAGRTADHAEGVRAFVEKRAPNFQGR